MRIFYVHFACFFFFHENKKLKKEKNLSFILRCTFKRLEYFCIIRIEKAWSRIILKIEYYSKRKIIILDICCELTDRHTHDCIYSCSSLNFS